ncbi:hypothetical protein [Ferrimonas balearica]|uniref:hypothetical protein n=1 Tax=Ferrimonas balearica TaxID=44012 RepID=UPI001C999354|nr:hypothetical protein [Ferrimonas balearica]MBY5920166.1 hypothetical protein [Ferrimonas balearica]MBY5997149.1 hypothetical protein [Ferrimonas balearica]
MKLKNLFTLSALTSALLLAGCGGDININTGSETTPTTPTNPDPTSPTEKAYGAFAARSTQMATVDGKEVWTLSGNLIGESINLGADVVWELSGAVVVGGDNTNQTVLTIAPGTKILGNSDAYLVISRGSQIMAEGTAANPIVFTSVESGLGLTTDRGQWGGLVLLGNAPVNSCADLANCDVAFEVGNHNYGGNNEADSSGSLKYVRVEFGGFKINDTQELNGVSFAGVGSGTQVDYLQVHMNDDDGIEFWGGNATVKHVVLTGNFDDSLDWTNGWRGAAQHVYIRTEDNSANRGIEADSSKSGTDEPMSKPTLANLTLQLGGGTNGGGDDAEGILFRVGTGASVFNTLVKGSLETGECLEINDASTIANADAAELTMTHSLIDCVEPFKNPKDDGGNALMDVAAWFQGQEGNLVGAAALEGYQPSAVSPALTGGKTGLANIDSRLDDADYIGAFDGNDDWTLGWTTAIHDEGDTPVVLTPLTSCPAGTSNDAADAALIEGTDLVCTLSGNVTSNVTLLAGTNVKYKLDGGAVVIGGDKTQSATLAIQAGVEVYGTSNSYLVISRGSKIMAQGSEAHPIVFTSSEDVLGLATDRGQWGGLVLLGNAPVNTCASLDDCDVAFEVGNHLFGGNNDADSSGQLSYVQVRYAGFKINDTQELNGISFGGVGSGTQVDHIQVHMNDDDGVEFWGGSVSLKYVYLTDNFDDSLDWTNGWTGKAQYVFITQQDNAANRGIEADSSKSDPLGTPFSNPTLSNVTILPAGGNNGGDDAEGMVLRVATRAQLANFVIQGGANTGECLEIDDASTLANAQDGTLTMTHSIIDCVEPVKNEDSFDTTAWFNGQEGNVIGAVELNNGMPTASSIALGTGKDMSSVDSFFDATDYKGAFDGQNDWTQGWSYQQ